MNLNDVKEPLVLYHSPCRDGWCSAFLAKLRWPDAELVPINYGDLVDDPLPGIFYSGKTTGAVRFDLNGRNVLILDFSFPRDVLLRMKESSRSLLVLDHHKSAAADLAGLDFAVFDMERSGAGLALDHFFPGSRERLHDIEEHKQDTRKIPPTMAQGGPAIWVVTLALYCEDWDTWKFKREGTKEVCAFLDTVPRTEEAWMELPCPADMKERGAAVLAYQKQQVERIADHSYLRKIDGTPVNVANSPVLQSEVGEALYQKWPEVASLVWYVNEEGWVVCSLRSKAGVGPNVSEIARKFGGGGHKNAAGFKTMSLAGVWE